MVVYKYDFDRFNSIYIDKTPRQLYNRVRVHKCILFISGLQLTSPPFITIRKKQYNNPN